jgi:hypothetical protein
MSDVLVTLRQKESARTQTDRRMRRRRRTTAAGLVAAFSCSGNGKRPKESHLTRSTEAIKAIKAIKQNAAAPVYFLRYLITLYRMKVM